MHKKRISTLEDLPINIIVKIARLLPPRSVACLTLTSKSLHDAKGLKDIWTLGFDPSRNRCGCRTQSQPTCPPLELVNHERYLFLQILSRDLLSTHQLCDACQILHLRWYERGNERHVCSSTSRAFTICGIPRSYWEFQDVQRIMNSYRLAMQRETRKQFRLSTINNDWCVRYRAVKTRTRQGPSMKQLPQIVKLDVEQRIINDQLVFHTRQRVLLTAAVLDLMDVQLQGPKFTVGRLVNNLMSACPHYGGESQIIKAVNESIAELEAKYLNQPVGLRCRGTLKCTCCPTEFTLANYHHPGQGFEILLETWTNLGPCQWGYQSEWQLASREGFHRCYSGGRRARWWGQSASKLPSDLDNQWVNRKLEWATDSLAETTHTSAPAEYITDLVLFGHNAPSISDEDTRRPAPVQSEEFQTASKTSADPPNYRVKDDPPPYQVLTSRPNTIVEHMKTWAWNPKFQKLRRRLLGHGRGIEFSNKSSSNTNIHVAAKGVNDQGKA
jgi:hypothetical protein